MFPVKILKDRWSGAKGTKDAVCSTIAADAKWSEIIDFVDRYFGCCKQHVHVLKQDSPIRKLPTAGTSSGERVLERIEKNHGSGLYFFWAEFTAVMTEPYEKTTLKFIWPLRLDFDKDAVLVRLVILEKNLKAHLKDRDFVAAQKVTDEENIVGSVIGGLECHVSGIDLHKGIKKLWQQDVIDCIRVRHKEPYSLNITIMDEERGIRETNPELYQTLLKSSLISATFRVKSTKLSDVSHFAVEPSKGYLAFPRYTEHEGDTDNVVREILKHNG